MFSSLSPLSSSASATSNSVSSAATEVLGEVQSQSFEEEIPLTSKDEVEKKLAFILTQVQQNQVKCLNLTPASLGRFYELTYTLSGHEDAVCSLAVIKKRGAIASSSVSQESAIKLWDLALHSCLATLQGHTAPIYALTVLLNGQLASGSDDDTVKLWDLASRSCLATLQGHTYSILTLAALPNGQLIGGPDDNTIRIWNVTSNSCLSILQGHTHLVTVLAVLPNSQLASGSADRTIKLWEPKTLSVQHLQPILNALKNNTSVTDLDLSGNQDILDDLVDPLMSIFTQDVSSGSKPNSSLKTIDLRRTGVSQKGVKKLEKVIQHQRLSIAVLFDCPIGWMVIYFLIIFCRANRNSPFADSCLDLAKHGKLGPFSGIPSIFFIQLSKNPSSSKRIALSPHSPS